MKNVLIKAVQAIQKKYKKIEVFKATIMEWGKTEATVQVMFSTNNVVEGYTEYKKTVYIKSDGSIEISE